MIRAIAPADRAAWQRLFTDYGVFYETQFTDDVDSDRVPVGGVVLEEMDDDDSLVRHVEAGLALSQAARP